MAQVDVFSAGVVFYICLFYPQRPFFRDATQQQIMAMSPQQFRAETDALVFGPAKISAECQGVLRRVLAPSKDDRPDVATLLDDPYFSKAK